MTSEDHLRMFIRVKPPNDYEVKWQAVGAEVRSMNSNERYPADHVFSPLDDNEQVFQTVGKLLVEDTVSGFNTALCAYGQSGSGKTHTLLGSPNEEGVVHHILRHLFTTMANHQENETRTFLVQMQVMELYCERIRDLLNPSALVEPTIVEENNLPQVQNVKEFSITSPEQAIDLIEEAQSNRVVGETALNERSSRSHAIIHLSVESSLTVAGASKLKTRRSVMSIVDLAGSENAALASGIRQREGNQINKSLFHLTKVINMLTDKNPPKYIPYRDSKLTRMLKPSLGGNSKTMMICCMDPGNQDETARTLKFSERVKMVKSCAQVNEDEEEGKLGQFLEEIERLKRDLAQKELEAAAKEKQDKEDRLGVLKAQLISGGQKETKNEQIMHKARRMTWAPGALKAAIRRGSLSPVAKKARGLEQINETELESTRNSDPLANSIRHSPDPSYRKRGSSNRSERLGNEELNELDKLRFDSLQLEMRVRQLESEKNILLEEHDQRVTILNNRIAQIEEEAKEMEKALKTSEQTIKDMQFFEQRLVAVECELDSVKNERNGANAARERTETLLLETKAENIRLLAEHDMKQRDVLEQIKSLLDEKKCLEERMSLGEMNVVERERLVARGEQLAEEVSSLKGKLQSVQDLLDEEAEQRKRLEHCNEQAKKKIEESWSAFSKEKEDLTVQLRESREKMESARLDWLEKERLLNQNIETLKENYSISADEALVKKDSQIAALEQKISDLEDSMTKAEADARENLTRVISEVQKKVEEQMKKDQEELKQLRNDVASLRRTNEMLISEAQDRTRASQSNEELKSTLDDLQDQLLAKETIVAELKAKLEKLLPFQDQVEKLNQKCHELRRERDLKNTTIDNHVSRIQEYRRDLQDSDATITKAKKDLESVMQELETERREKEEAKKVVHSMTTSWNEEKRRWEGEKAAFVKNEEKTQSSTNALQKRILVLQSDLNQVNRQLSEARQREEDGFQKNAKMFSEKIVALEKDVMTMKKALENKEDDLMTAKNELEKQKMVSSRAVKEVQQLRTELEQGESGEKERRLADLSRHLENTRRLLNDAEENLRVEKERRGKVIPVVSENKQITELSRQLEETRNKLQRKALEEKENEGTNYQTQLEEMRRKLQASEELNKKYAQEKEVGLTKYMKLKEQIRLLTAQLQKKK